MHVVPVRRKGPIGIEVVQPRISHIGYRNGSARNKEARLVRAATIDRAHDAGEFRECVDNIDFRLEPSIAPQLAHGRAQRDVEGDRV